MQAIFGTVLDRRQGGTASAHVDERNTSLSLHNGNTPRAKVAIALRATRGQEDDCVLGKIGADTAVNGYWKGCEDGNRSKMPSGERKGNKFILCAEHPTSGGPFSAMSTQFCRSFSLVRYACW